MLTTTTSPSSSSSSSSSASPSSSTNVGNTAMNTLHYERTISFNRTSIKRTVTTRKTYVFIVCVFLSFLGEKEIFLFSND